jgi:hypothetical protein
MDALTAESSNNAGDSGNFLADLIAILVACDDLSAA